MKCRICTEPKIAWEIGLWMSQFAGRRPFSDRNNIRMVFPRSVSPQDDGMYLCIRIIPYELWGDIRTDPA